MQGPVFQVLGSLTRPLPVGLGPLRLGRYLVLGKTHYPRDRYIDSPNQQEQINQVHYSCGALDQFFHNPGSLYSVRVCESSLVSNKKRLYASSVSSTVLSSANTPPSLAKL